MLGSANPYLCGKDMTIADYFAAPFVALAETIGSDLSAYPNVRAWLGRMKALPAWEQTSSHRRLRAHAQDQLAMVASEPAMEATMILKLHHNAYRCRDSEETRPFYEDFLGLPLVGTLEITETKSGRATNTLHTFYRLDDGSYLAFFEAPDMPFEFKPQHDYDLHIALEVDRPTLRSHVRQGQGRGHRDTRRVRPRLHRLDLLPRSRTAT